MAHWSGHAIVAATAMVLAACAGITPAAAPRASGALVTGEGKPAGTVSLADTAAGMVVTIAAAGLPPGEHGVHFHAVGRCDGPKFESAGAHWNPTARQHGALNPLGKHQGDLPNITVGSNGIGTASFTVPGAAVRGGAMPLLDHDGAALVIHAKADDYRSDPSGNSGDRIACAVIVE